MKARNYFILPLCVGGLSVSALGQEASNGAAIGAAVGGAAGYAPAGSVEALAAKAGFAKYLPQSSDMLFSFYNGAGLTKKLRGTELGQFVESLAAKDGVDFDELSSDPDFRQFAAIAGEEIFMALGDGGAEQTKTLLDLTSKNQFHQFRFLVKMMASELLGAEMEPGGPLSAGPGMAMNAYLFDLLKSDDGKKIFEGASMPPLYIGFKVSDKEQRATFLAQMQGLGDMALADEEPFMLEAKSDVGNGFSGFQIKGAELAKLITGEPADVFAQEVGVETLEFYKKQIAQKDLVVMVGEVDDYLVIFAGSHVDDLQLAATPAESVLADKGMAFAKAYGDKELVSLVYASESLSKVTVEGRSAVGDMVGGIMAGIQESEAFGDTRVIEALMADLIDREKNLFSMNKGSRSGVVAYLENGFKIEGYGGANAPALDMESGRKLATLGAKDDVLFSANWVNNPEYTKQAMDYMEAFGSTAYLLTKQVSDLDIEDPDFKEFSEGFNMVDSQFKAELLELWSALSKDLSNGLGAETAIVVDINGEMPTVPEVPSAIIKNGKVPRISYVSTVADRSKIQASWTKLNSTAEVLLKKVSEMSGSEIPMQRPFKNQSDGLTSWTLPIPMTHQNCTPSITLSDELFFATSSPDFATALASRYDASAKESGGCSVNLNFDAMRTLASNWLSLLDAHGAEFMSEYETEEFKEEIKPMMEKFLEAMKECESLNMRMFTEQGESRSSFHFKMR